MLEELIELTWAVNTGKKCNEIKGSLSLAELLLPLLTWQTMGWF